MIICEICRTVYNYSYLEPESGILYEDDIMKAAAKEGWTLQFFVRCPKHTPPFTEEKTTTSFNKSAMKIVTNDILNDADIAALKDAPPIVTIQHDSDTLVLNDSPPKQTRYAGSDWVQESLRIEPSEFGKRVADLLGEWVGGLYHIQTELGHKRVDFTREDWIEIVMGWSTLSTYDFDKLTRLVFLCHHYQIRMELRAKAYGYLEFVFYNAPAYTGVTHPTLDQAVASFKKNR